MIAPGPLLLLAEGRRPRLRKQPAYRPKEFKLHVEVANVLRDHCFQDWKWTHPAAGELRDIRTAVRLKRMGVHPGWPDIIMISPDARLHSLELKRVGEDLTDEQEDFRAWSFVHRAPYAVAHDLKEALAALDSWGCLRIRLNQPTTELEQNH